MSILDDILGGVVSGSDLASKLGKPESDLRLALELTEKATVAATAAIAAWRQTLAAAEPIIASYGVKLQPEAQK